MYNTSRYQVSQYYQENISTRKQSLRSEILNKTYSDNNIRCSRVSQSTPYTQPHNIHTVVSPTRIDNFSPSVDHNLILVYSRNPRNPEIQKLILIFSNSCIKQNTLFHLEPSTVWKFNKGIKRNIKFFYYFIHCYEKWFNKLSNIFIRSFKHDTKVSLTLMEKIIPLLCNYLLKCRN